MSFIAISGKRRSGKTTLANILANKFGYYPVNLASPLKRMCMEHFDLGFSQVDGDLKETADKRYDMTPRQIMIHMGQFYRSVDPNFWVEKLMVSCSNPFRNYVVADMRFINELERLKENGALLVRLERDEALTGTNIQDESETQLDNYGGWDLIVPTEANRNMDDLSVTANKIQELVLANNRNYTGR